MTAAKSLARLLSEVRSCRVCEPVLPLGARPVVQVGSRARIVVVGQAPGTKVHESGIPWDDASGDHLREWMALDRDAFYDPDHVALIPMGFCYPGKRAGGDAPPRRECAPLWHEALLNALQRHPLIVLAGQYAHAHYLASTRKKTLTDTVRDFRNHLPRYLPLPHPSWRSKLWMKKNPWFELELLPVLRTEIRSRLP